MKGKRGLWKGLMAVLLFLAVLLPMGMVYAETPLAHSTVAGGVGFDGLGMTYQRHSFYALDREWVFYSNSSNGFIEYRSSNDNENWGGAHQVLPHICDRPYGYCSWNGSDFSLWYDEPSGMVAMAVIPIGGMDYDILYTYGQPYSNGSIVWGNLSTAVEGETDLEYFAPSICVDTGGYPYIAYMAQNWSAGSMESWLTTSILVMDNDWFTFDIVGNFTGSENNVMYPSVIPITAGNVSLMYVADTGLLGNLQLIQQYVNGWRMETEPLSVVNSPLNPIDLNNAMYHSEVSINTSLNPDDIFVVWAENESGVNRMMFNRYGNPGENWMDGQELATYLNPAAISVRNDIGGITVTAVNGISLTDIMSSDGARPNYVMTPLVNVMNTSMTWYSMMASYQHGSPLGFLYLDNGMPFDLNLGEYGNGAPSTPPSVSSILTVMMQIVGILMIVVGILLLVAMLFKVDGLGVIGKMGIVVGISVLIAIGAIVTMGIIGAF